MLYLYDAADREIGVDDDNGPGTYSELNETLAAGEYYLRVSSFARAPGAYSLTVEVETTEATDPGAATPAESAEIVPLSADGQPVTARLTNSNMDVWFQVNVEERGLYAIATFPPSDGLGVDTVVELYNQDRSTRLGEDDDGGPDVLLVVKAIGTPSFSTGRGRGEVAGATPLFRVSFGPGPPLQWTLRGPVQHSPRGGRSRQVIPAGRLGFRRNDPV